MSLHNNASSQAPAWELPGRIAELAEVIGLRAALKLVELRGGVRLYVPHKPSQDHWLAIHLSDEELASLCAYYAGETIEIDRCAAAVRATLEASIINDHQHGASISQLALKYGYTERGIRKLRARVGGYVEPPTVDLFEFFNGGSE